MSQRKATLLLRAFGAAALAAFAFSSRGAHAQQADETVEVHTHIGSTDPFQGAFQTVNAPNAAQPGKGAVEIFPDASRVFMSASTVAQSEAIAIESARRGTSKWVCSDGACTLNAKDLGPSDVGDAILRSIKLQTPTLPLPLTIWGRSNDNKQRVLDFDPVLLGRRSYQHICAYPPTLREAPPGKPGQPPPAPKAPEKPGACPDGPMAKPLPDSAELLLGMEWPSQSELANFRYLAVVDSCGNARVMPFQRTFFVPVWEVASGGCGAADGKVLRVFPHGGWIRVTAFNLDGPAMGSVVNATYRVTIPALENTVETTPTRLLFPDFSIKDLQIDCGPLVKKALPDSNGAPTPPPPGAGRPEPAPVAPPPDEPPPPPPGAEGKKPDANGKPGATVNVNVNVNAGGKKVVAPPAAPPPPPPPAIVDVQPTGPGPQPLAHEALVIAPEPLRQGLCRIKLTGQTKNRLSSPLALYVSLQRTDKLGNNGPIELIPNGTWIITPGSAEFNIPPLSPENFDGDSRLRLTVSSDPLSPGGKVVLLADAGRVSASLRANEAASTTEQMNARRLIGSVVIHSVPLCGASNFETLDNSGSCLRAYVTFPIVFALLQVTRAPWVERPLVTRAAPLAAIGFALAFDSYNPVERKAFPVALQVGGLYEQLGDGRNGLLGYVGLAPTVPILGEGGNTTTIGLLGGIGIEYITNDNGPNEGLKPAAFVGAAVQIGQATPNFAGAGKASIGSK